MKNYMNARTRTGGTYLAVTRHPLKDLEVVRASLAPKTKYCIKYRGPRHQVMNWRFGSMTADLTTKKCNALAFDLYIY